MNIPIVGSLLLLVPHSLLAVVCKTMRPALRVVRACIKKYNTINLEVVPFKQTNRKTEKLVLLSYLSSSVHSNAPPPSTIDLCGIWWDIPRGNKILLRRGELRWWCWFISKKIYFA